MASSARDRFQKLIVQLDSIVLQQMHIPRIHEIVPPEAKANPELLPFVEIREEPSYIFAEWQRRMALDELARRRFEATPAG